MADDDTPPPVRLVPRGPWDAALDPTDTELLHQLDPLVRGLIRRMVSVEDRLARLEAPDEGPTRLAPQDVFGNIARARARLAELYADGGICDGDYSEAMEGLAASERHLYAVLGTVDGVVADIDRYR